MPRQITPEELLRFNPRVSRSTLEANSKGAAVAAITERPQCAVTGSQKLRVGRQPNKTEAEFGILLAAMKGRGEILHYAYEGISLRWGDGMRYTADYAAWPADGGKIRLVELKGRDKIIRGKVTRRRDDAIVRFKGCMAEWKEWFAFEMHEKRDGQWQRIA